MNSDIILHDYTGSFLLLENDRGDQAFPRLPSLTKHGKNEDDTAFEFYCRISDKCGDLLEPPMTMRYHIIDEKDGEIAVVFELQCRRCKIDLKPEYSWTRITPALLQRIKDSYPPLIWRAVNNIADETLDNTSTKSVPIFSKRGFWKQVRNTIQSRLKQCGRESDCSLQRHTTSGNSAVISVFFAEGPKLYYKVSERGRPEALFTQTLARLIPELVVTPFGVDVTDNSFFTEDFGETAGDCVRNGDYLEEKVDKYVLRPAVDAIAEFHKRAAKHVDGLRKLGMADTSPQRMRIELPVFISQVQQMGILMEGEAQAMRERLPVLYKCLDDLIDGNVPLTVCHGDLHFDNIRHPPSVNDMPPLFDWYESTISHPFLDILTGNFVSLPWYNLYIEQWMSYGSSDHIWDLAGTADLVHDLWDVFRRVKMMVKRDHQLGAEVTLSYCRDMLKRFVELKL